MPRQGRLHIPGGYYHVIGRGLERRYIFESVPDKESFLSRLGSNLVRTQSQCLAWALMSNHYHLLIRVNQFPLAKLMAPILGGYAGDYNRRHSRCGYVFQNRFQSILCDADSYLLALVRYIHLNPLRAGMVENLAKLERYRWTGHAAVFGRHRQDWHEVEEMLSYFSSTSKGARKSYQQFLQESDSASAVKLSGGGLVRSAGSWEALSKLRREHIQVIGDERILGDSDFVEGALQQDELAMDSRSCLEWDGLTLKKLISQVSQMYGIDERELLRQTRKEKISEAKSLICYWGAEELGCTSREIAAELQITPPAVTYRSKKGRELAESRLMTIESLLR